MFITSNTFHHTIHKITINDVDKKTFRCVKKVKFTFNVKIPFEQDIMQ